MRDKIAGLRAQLAEIRAEKIKVQKQLRNERRQQARLKSKAKSLSTAALKQIVLERETEPSVAVQRKRAKVTKQKKLPNRRLQRPPRARPCWTRPPRSDF
jgi:hypothetical protein